MSFLEFVKTGTLRKNLRLHILHRSFSCFFFTASCKQLREKFEGERNLKESFPALLGIWSTLTSCQEKRRCFKRILGGGAGEGAGGGGVDLVSRISLCIGRLRDVEAFY